MSHVKALHRREAFLPRCKPVLLTCQPWPSTSSRLSRRMQARHCVGCLWGGGAARALTTLALRAALAVVGTCPMEGHCTSETHPSLGATPWFNVPAAPPNEQQRLRGVRKRATALAVCGEDAQYARLRRPRAVPRWLWSVHALRKGTEPARSLSASVQDRALSYQLRPPTSGRRSRDVRKRATALTIYGEEAQHARLRRARAVPRWLWSAHAL